MASIYVEAHFLVLSRDGGEDLTTKRKTADPQVLLGRGSMEPCEGLLDCTAGRVLGAVTRYQGVGL